MKYLKMIVLFLARIRIGLSFSLFIALAEFFFFFFGFLEVQELTFLMDAWMPMK